MAKKNTIKAYKGFDKDMKCRDFQYEVGKTYEMDGRITCCDRGFHACENPFDVLSHYPMFDRNGTPNRFCVVEQSGDIDKSRNDSIIASSKIKVRAELKFVDFIKTAIEWITEKTSPANIDTENGDFFAQISSSNDNAQIGSRGDNAQIGSSGDFARIGSSGDFAQIGSSGHRAQIGSSGDDVQIGSGGNRAKIGSSGDDAQIGSSSHRAQIGSSGGNAKIGSSGDHTHIISSGGNAKIGSSGDVAQIGSNGDYAKIGSSGYGAKIQSIGEDAVICCAGHNSIVSAKKGSWITLSEWKYDVNKGQLVPICVKTEYVDGKRIKENTPYRLWKGEFVEAYDSPQDGAE